MKIIDCKSISSDKRTRVVGGFYIDFISSENVVEGDMFKVVYENKEHYFSASDITIVGKDLKISAKESGYWVNYFDRMSGLDIRNLIDLPIIKETDQKIIAEIREKSLYC